MSSEAFLLPFFCPISLTFLVRLSKWVEREHKPVTKMHCTGWLNLPQERNNQIKDEKYLVSRPSFCHAYILQPFVHIALLKIEQYTSIRIRFSPTVDFSTRGLCSNNECWSTNATLNKLIMPIWSNFIVSFTCMLYTVEIQAYTESSISQSNCWKYTPPTSLHRCRRWIMLRNNRTVCSENSLHIFCRICASMWLCIK